ncbi:MAG: phospho-sugar mutase [Leptospiraceae bacterium]|nr:phospho-sugar mutase [Leptospiraceae bacterium]MDW8306334.1 phospho-sugar mutase [Leptospiraceae bacterium]
MQEKLYEEFLRAPLKDNERAQLIEKKNHYLEEGSFDKEPEFGTGGMRATVGLGTNHLNRYIIVRLNLALAQVLKKHFGRALVVVGYDSRLSSPEFSRLTYHVLTQQGHEVRVFRRPTPTPFVSFAVRELQAQAGVVLTASHNPPEYNGFKVYWSDGAQIVPPLDKEIENKFRSIPYGSLPTSLHEWAEKEVPMEHTVEEEIVAAYIEHIKREPFVTNKEKKISILYSPLYGTGGWIFERLFRELGFKNFQILKEQAEPNGNFPGLKSANPEEREAFHMLLEKGAQMGADLLLATDPDADRLGCAVKTQDGYVFLNGNQIGSLLVEVLARTKAKNLKNPYICKTIVTTQLQYEIARAYGVSTYETLTGFKYIAEILGKDPDNYIFGGEESYGYLPVSWVRDKDALSSALALAELAEENSLIAILDELYLKHGLYVEKLYNIHLTGEHKNFMPILLQKLKEPHSLWSNQTIGKRKIVDVLDLQEGARLPNTEELRRLQEKLPKGLVVQYYLEPEGRLTIRPSGTEPKVKVYLSLRYGEVLNRENLAQAKEDLEKEAEMLLQLAVEKLLA